MGKRGGKEGGRGEGRREEEGREGGCGEEGRDSREAKGRDGKGRRRGGWGNGMKRDGGEVKEGGLRLLVEWYTRCMYILIMYMYIHGGVYRSLIMLKLGDWPHHTFF